MSRIPPTERDLIDAALAEDIGRADWTTRWTIPEDAPGTARIVTRAAGVIAGTRTAASVFRRLDPEMRLLWRCTDGDRVGAGDEIAKMAGLLRAILTGERTALNFLGHLSGVATLASRYAAAVRGTGCRVVDTRKTTPGWRALEKEAVTAGGA